MILMACLLASPLLCFGAGGNPSSPASREKETKKGADIIAKLRLLEQLTASAPDFKTYRALMNKLYPRLFIEAAALTDGDLKADLTTAVFLYDEALQRFHETAGARPLCADEARAVYADLCAQARGTSLTGLLWAKARLHTAWAAATVNDRRGLGDASTLAALAEMRRERAVDLMLAARVIEKLRAVEREVCAYPSLGEFEAHQKLALVSFEQLSKDVMEALPEIDRNLRALPRSPLFYALYHARNSYLDGLFWWRKTYRRGEMVVSASSFTEPDEMKSSKLDAGVVNYTIAVNWRKAIEHTREAVSLIEALRTAGD